MTIATIFNLYRQLIDDFKKNESLLKLGKSKEKISKNFHDSQSKSSQYTINCLIIETKLSNLKLEIKQFSKGLSQETRDQMKLTDCYALQRLDELAQQILRN